MANYNLSSESNLQEIKADLLMIMKSPNPFSLYVNATKIKDKFSLFISSLSKKISDGFKLEDNGNNFVFQIYKNSSYDKIWIDVLQCYLRDSKNFDLLSYFYFVKTLNKDKETLALALLKLKNSETEENIKEFLSTSNFSISFENVKSIFDKYLIWNMDFSINLKEEFVEHFLEKIYLNLDENYRDLFLDNFILKINIQNVVFSDMSLVLSKVISSYNSWTRKYFLDKTLKWEYFSKDKKLVDELIDKYLSNRWNFYFELTQILKDLPLVDRWLFWQYVRTRMIDEYYAEVKYLFYSYASENFLSKDIYNKLKWEFKMVNSISPEAEYMYNDYNEINDLKDIIIWFSSNSFSSFSLPVLYYIISENLSISKSDLHKMKYLLLFIFSSNYWEYKKIYMFFNQLEIFLDYEEKSNVFWKIKVWFSIVLLLSLVLFLTYLYLPIWIFLWIFFLALVKYFEIANPNFYYNQTWNVWVKFFALLFLTVSSYYSLQNLDEIKKSSNEVLENIEYLWKIPTRDVVDNSARFIKTSILEFNNLNKK